MDLETFARQATEVADMLRMLANDRRLMILCKLVEWGEANVTSLVEAVGLSQSALSQHLAKMRLARMVSTRQDGTRVLYRLENEHARQLVADAIFQAEHALGGKPAHHRTAKDAS